MPSQLLGNSRVTKSAPPSKSKPKPTAKPRPSKSAKSADRMETDVLLSIKSVHLANIVSQKKNHEYRKYRLRDGVERLWFYETGDEGGKSAITHIAMIPDSVRRTPGTVPTEPFGIGNDDFNAGRKVSKYGVDINNLNLLNV